jgi:hypothetical protein
MTCQKNLAVFAMTNDKGDIPAAAECMMTDDHWVGCAGTGIQPRSRWRDPNGNLPQLYCGELPRATSFGNEK